MDFENPVDLRGDVDRFQALQAKRESFGLSAEDDAELLELSNRLLPVIEQFGQFATAITTAMRLAYEQEGKPLGEDDEAMWKWAQDRAADERSRLDAEADAAWQQSVEDFQQRRIEQRRN